MNAQQKEVQRRTVREIYAFLNVDQLWCIVLPANGNFELRSALVHHILKLHGMSIEKLVKYIKEFLVLIETMKADNENEEALKMKVFPFSLLDQAKHWPMSLSAGSFITWAQLQQKFLD